jgi:hypothetical protein
MAQLRAAIVQDRDNQARNFYQESESCTGFISPCTVTFAAVPAGKRLIVQQVSVLAQFSASTTAPQFVQLGGTNNFYQYIPMAPVPMNTATDWVYVGHVGVQASYDAAQVPSVYVFMGGGGAQFDVGASISGYMVDIP